MLANNAGNYGPQQWGDTGEKIQVLINSENARWKIGGVTLDWTTVAPVGTPINEIQQISETGTPNSGSAVYTFTNPITGATATATIPYNASAVTAQGLIDTAIGAGNSLVGGGALPGTPLTVQFIGGWALQNVAPITVDDAGLGAASGTPHAVITTTQAGIAVVNVNNGLIIQPANKYLRYGQVITQITASRKYGPYDPAASDGRQTLTRGYCFILNETAVMAPLVGVPALMTASNIQGVLFGGDLVQGRIIQSGANAHSLAAGPTYAELVAAFPMVQPQRFN